MQGLPGGSAAVRLAAPAPLHYYRAAHELWDLGVANCYGHTLPCSSLLVDHKQMILSLGWPGLVDPTLRCLLTHQRGAVAATSRTVGPTSKRTIVPNPKQEPWLRTLHAAVGDVTPEEPHPFQCAQRLLDAALGGRSHQPRGHLDRVRWRVASAVRCQLHFACRHLRKERTRSARYHAGPNRDRHQT